MPERTRNEPTLFHPPADLAADPVIPPTQVSRSRPPVPELIRTWPDFPAEITAGYERLTPDDRAAATRFAELITADQRARWAAGDRVRVERYLDQFPLMLQIDQALSGLIFGEIRLRQEAGESADITGYLVRFPRLVPALEHHLRAGGPPVHDMLPTIASVIAELPSPVRPEKPSGITTIVPGSEPDAETYPALPGYEFLDLIGRGGMGVVYKAVRTDLKRTVALKMIRDSVIAGPEKVARFRAEASAVAALDHPNIIRIHHSGEYRGIHFLEMEWIERGTLAKVLKREPQPVHLAARMVYELAQAMHYAHSKRIIHRDLKPQNILLTAGNVLKISDFGLAKRLDDDLGLTISGDIRGTVGYMSPEQASGRRDLTPAVDIYALGAILYEMLVGEPPFKATELAAALDMIRLLPPRRPRDLRPDLHPDLETICLKCLEKEPAQRYETAEALAEDLRRYLYNEPIRGRATGVEFEGRIRKVLSCISKPWYVKAGFELKRQYGRDGIAQVYRATDLETGRAVLLKVIPNTATAGEREAFRRAVADLARLRHPGIAGYLEVGEQSGYEFLVCDSGTGVSLDHLPGGLPMSPGEAALTARELCAIVQYAHDQGVLHRDLKTSQVLTSDRLTVRGFGLVNPADDFNNMTPSQLSMILGYLAPELATGDVKHNVGSDVYGLGAILFDLLTGHPPVNTYRQLLFQPEPTPPLGRLSGPLSWLDSICLTALHREPSKRYQTAAAFAADLTSFLDRVGPEFRA